MAIEEMEIKLRHSSSGKWHRSTLRIGSRSFLLPSKCFSICWLTFHPNSEEVNSPALLLHKAMVWQLGLSISNGGPEALNAKQPRLRLKGLGQAGGLGQFGGSGP